MRIVILVLHSSLYTLNSALELAPEVGIAPTSPPLQGGANLPQLLGENDSVERDSVEMRLNPVRVRRSLTLPEKSVVSAGNAPASSGYRPEALLLSYGTLTSSGFNPNRRTGRKTIFTFPVGRIRIVRTGL
jgi:hypothetical protein